VNIICDLDGTIALDTGRAQYLHKNEGCPKHLYPNDNRLVCECLPSDRDWNSYFDDCDTDEPCHAVIHILRNMTPYHTIYILSGRSMSAQKKTNKWLYDNDVPYNFLQMRGTDDRTADDVLKLQWASVFDLTPLNTLFVLEDRTRVVDAWRAAGFRCFQVAPGNF
jgi:hypothetical protein